MKKTLLAAALLAGFAGAAQAQTTSVTLFGLIDAGVGYHKIKPGKSTESFSRVAVQSGSRSGSRWGLRGSEDLGSGLRAIFTLESGFSVATGRSGQDNRLFGRQATLGLASDDWGTLEFGRRQNITSVYMTDVDPFGTGTGQANVGLGMSASNGPRYDNMIMYQTPNIYGFEAGIGYSFAINNKGRTIDVDVSAAEVTVTEAQEKLRTTDNIRAITAALRYVNGPINAFVAYDQLRQRHDRGLLESTEIISATQAFSSSNATPRSYTFGASYDFEIVKLAAAYAHTSDGWFAAQGAGIGLGVSSGGTINSNVFAGNFKANSYMLGATIPVDGTSVIVMSGQLVDPKNNILTGGAKKMSAFSTAYTYNFSKRTDLYGYASYVANYAFIDGVKSTAVGAGLRHRF